MELHAVYEALELPGDNPFETTEKICNQADQLLEIKAEAAAVIDCAEDDLAQDVHQVSTSRFSREISHTFSARNSLIIRCCLATYAIQNSGYPDVFSHSPAQPRL